MKSKLVEHFMEKIAKPKIKQRCGGKVIYKKVNKLDFK